MINFFYTMANDCSTREIKNGIFCSGSLCRTRRTGGCPEKHHNGTAFLVRKIIEQKYLLHGLHVR
jgi:hypothetical protein